MAILAIIHLKDFSQIPRQKHYLLRLEVRESQIPIIKGLKEYGLLIECSSPCNPPILGVRRGLEWRLVQDFRLINETVIPLHPVVPNPYALLAQYLLGDNPLFSLILQGGLLLHSTIP
jgi:hypothetical protein